MRRVVVELKEKFIGQMIEKDPKEISNKIDWVIEYVYVRVLGTTKKL